jgi:hypothetical protein
MDISLPKWTSACKIFNPLMVVGLIVRMTLKLRLQRAMLSTLCHQLFALDQSETLAKVMTSCSRLVSLTFWALIGPEQIVDATSLMTLLAVNAPLVTLT